MRRFHGPKKKSAKQKRKRIPKPLRIPGYGVAEFDEAIGQFVIAAIAPPNRDRHPRRR